MKPGEIEALSFKIIEKEVGAHGFSRRKWQIVRRMIHTSADFEYLTMTRFHERAIDAGLDAIFRGCTIFTDTNMARVGIRKMESDRFGVNVKCLIADPPIGELAAKKGITRAQASVDAVLPEMSGSIYVVGNAPTALLRLIAKIESGEAEPALVVGLPVGFVNAAESKDALMAIDIPYISNVGRKGGSNLAASVVNALLIMAAENTP